MMNSNAGIDNQIGKMASPPRSRSTMLVVGVILTGVASLLLAVWQLRDTPVAMGHSSSNQPLAYEPRLSQDDSGFRTVSEGIEPWDSTATLEEISDRFKRVGYRSIERLDRQLNESALTLPQRLATLYSKVAYLNFEGEAKLAYQVLEQIRSELAADDKLAARHMSTVLYMQGLTALRRGENENCIMCRGESSCILPVSKAALHLHPEGSRLAIRHFTEYLERFPEDLSARWLLNVAHMTLGEHPDQVDPRFLISLEHWNQNEFNIGKFRDIGEKVGVNRFNLSGGAIMDDFDNDGFLDLVTSTFDPTMSMSFRRNDGKGMFEDRTQAAGLSNQLGGLNCVQTDFNNDGYLDIFIIRGAWLNYPIRPSLLRNNKDGTFTDVTLETGLLHPVNSIAASWADYDNDGWLDLFVCCEKQFSRLYHNCGNDTFEEVAVAAGIDLPNGNCKGVAWIDFDNDGFQDLFLNHLIPTRGGKLYHNNRNGTFTEVTNAMGIDGPTEGFSCWSWDYDNDGWLDLFATCYQRNVGEVVRGMLGQSPDAVSSRLYHNLQGKGFEDVSRAAGLNAVYSTMGSNFGDFDNDGFLDMYLGTGDPNFSTLIPNRMFKNVAGHRFSEISTSSGTGHLQKGHGVACGDWDRDGNVDIFIEMGGAVNGDKYHNILFQNPGHKAHFLTVKLIGKKSNRAAIGARIKVVTAGANPQTIHRHISTGSSFGANPLQQTIGLAQADRIALLEIRWPTSGTTQVFRDVSVDQAIEITEFDTDFRQLKWKPIPVPK